MGAGEMSLDLDRTDCALNIIASVEENKVEMKVPTDGNYGNWAYLPFDGY